MYEDLDQDIYKNILHELLHYLPQKTCKAAAVVQKGDVRPELRHCKVSKHHHLGGCVRILLVQTLM